MIKNSDEIFIIEKYLQLKDICTERYLEYKWDKNKMHCVRILKPIQGLLALQCIECLCDGLLGTHNGI